MDVLPPDLPAEPNPAFEFEVPIGDDGQVWYYRLYWNERQGAWHLDLTKAGETIGLYGKKLTANWTVYRHTGRLPSGGVLALLDMDGDGKERPTYEGLGHRWKLAFLTDDDLTLPAVERPWTIAIGRSRTRFEARIISRTRRSRYIAVRRSGARTRPTDTCR